MPEVIWSLSENDIWGKVWAGCNSYEYRTLPDAFSDREILLMIDHPNFDNFSDELRGYIWNVIEKMAAGE